MASESRWATVEEEDPQPPPQIVLRPGAAQELLRGAGPSTGGSVRPLVRLKDAIMGRYKFKPVASRDSLFFVRRFSPPAPQIPRGGTKIASPALPMASEDPHPQLPFDLQLQTVQRSDAVSVARPRGGEITAAAASVPMASEDPHPLLQLPFDLQLQILQLSDAVTVVRCAATHKLLRDAILGQAQAFCRRLSVDPALLLGFSFWDKRGGRRATDTPPLPTGGQPLVRLDDRITEFTPLEWRDGLLVIVRIRPFSLCTIPYRNDLRVCNAFTGDVTASLPPTSIPFYRSICNMQWPRAWYITFVLLNTAGRSFELLVVGRGMHNQIFSSDRWEWGPVRNTSFPGHHHLTYDLGYISRPAVIGRTVYWLCSEMRPIPNGPAPLMPRIVSLDVDAAEGNMREVPSYCFSEMVYRDGRHFETSALLTSVRGGLCVFVLERTGISGWTPEAETMTWSRQFMLNRTELVARAVIYPHEFNQLRLHAYGERSGTMILEVRPCVFLRLDIGEDFNLVRLVRLGSQDRSCGTIKSLCLHEIHLVSLLRSMKSFPQGAQEIIHVCNGHVCEELRSEDDPQPENQNERCIVGSSASPSATTSGS